MNKTFIVLFFLFLLALPTITAESFKQWQEVDLRHSIRIDGAPSQNLVANITIRDPDNVVIVKGALMSYDIDSEEHNYTLTSGMTGKLGTYTYDITARGLGQNSTRSFSFEITPSGFTGMLGFSFLIILIAYGMLIVGLWKRDITLTLLGDFAIFFVGIWVLFYGLDVFKNYLTNGFAYITLGVAFYVGAKAAHEYIVG